MDSSKNIYHKQEPGIPPRRMGRPVTEPFKTQPPASSSTVPGTQPVGTQSIGAPISPMQIARQQMQMQPHSNMRRRRRRKDPEHTARKKNRLIWILAGLVIAAYVTLLVMRILKSRLDPLPANDSVAMAQPRASAVSSNSVAGTGGLPVTERVDKWTRGARLLDESESLLNSGRFPQAKDKLRLAGELVPDSSRQMLGMARADMSENNFVEAEKLLLRALDADPGSGEARGLLARALLQNGRNADALVIAEWMCAIDPYSEEGHDIAATAALSAQLNDVSKAVEHLKRLTNLRSTDPSVKNNLGQAYLRMGDLASARRTFEEIVRGDEQNSAAYFNLAITQVRQGLTNDVVNTLSRAASKIGDGFVAVWLNGSDFDAVRASPDFAALRRRLGSSSPIPAAPDKPAVAKP